MTRYKKEGWAWHGWFATKDIGQHEIVLKKNPTGRDKYLESQMWRLDLLRCALILYHQRYWTAADENGRIDMMKQFRSAVRRVKTSQEICLLPKRTLTHGETNENRMD